MTAKPYPIVIVEWRDAHNYLDWRDTDSIKKIKNHTQVVRSVGFLIEKNKREILLAFGLSADGEVESTLAIPRDWCQKIRRIG